MARPTPRGRRTWSGNLWTCASRRSTPAAVCSLGQTWRSWFEASTGQARHSTQISRVSWPSYRSPASGTPSSARACGAGSASSGNSTGSRSRGPPGTSSSRVSPASATLPGQSSPASRARSVPPPTTSSCRWRAAANGRTTWRCSTDCSSASRASRWRSPTCGRHSWSMRRRRHRGRRATTPRPWPASARRSWRSTPSACTRRRPPSPRGPRRTGSRSAAGRSASATSAASGSGGWWRRTRRATSRCTRRAPPPSRGPRRHPRLPPRRRRPLWKGVGRAGRPAPAPHHRPLPRRGSGGSSPRRSPSRRLRALPRAGPTRQSTRRRGTPGGSARGSSWAERGEPGRTPGDSDRAPGAAVG
mmetsp:Transcript_114555/g.324480  ORF Transcript_114555/g.324480 Transcript_114555/m.324480 type:complete len:359 (-) Transcript_114555:197-1273(-)